jgi:four helix bundle protein
MSAADFGEFPGNTEGLPIAPLGCMKQPSEKRKRTLALQDRAQSFSVAVNSCCPDRPPNIPSRTVWEQLVKAADSVSNNLVEADAGSSTADFANKMQLTLREAKEAKICLAKIRLGRLAAFERTTELRLEEEAGELSAIFATIVINVAKRQERERRERAARKRRPRTDP